MSDPVQTIKERLSIVDVVSSYVELHKAGKNFKGKSPFTNERTPSFYVSPDRGMYYCFSSSQGGDIFTFVEKMEGVDFKGALKFLAEKAGVELVPEDPKQKTERDTKYTILEEATKFFVTQLAVHKEAENYLLDRGVTAETIAKWRIGYVPGPPKNGWRHTREYLKGKNFSDDLIFKAGLIKEAQAGKEPYDVFRDRIMFPICDPSGRVVGFSGRILEKGSEAPKYVNSPETELFNKSEVLFGYDKAKNGIRHYDFSLIVEGQFDVVLAHQAGYHNAVAVSGTALTDSHIGLLQRISNRVVLALDADRAGIAAVKRAADLMLGRGIDLKVAKLPNGQDPADIIRQNKDDFKKLIGKATHVIEFLLQILKAEAKDDRTFKLKARDEILPVLLKIESQIDRDHFVGIVSEALGTTKEAILLDLARLANAKASMPNSKAPHLSVAVAEKTNPGVSRRESLLAYLVVSCDLLEGREQSILQKSLEDITTSTFSSMETLIKPEIKSELLFKLEETFEQMPARQRHEDLIFALNEFNTSTIKDAITSLKVELIEAERIGDEASLKLCVDKMTNLQKKLSDKRFLPEMFHQPLSL
jgi:DNA primase